MRGRRSTGADVASASTGGGLNLLLDCRHLRSSLRMFPTVDAVTRKETIPRKRPATEAKASPARTGDRGGGRLRSDRPESPIADLSKPVRYA